MGPQPEGPAAGAKSKVLVVEDDEEMRSAMGEALSLCGLDVRTAGDGPSAVDLVAHETFDVLVSDIRLPGMSGIDVVRKLRALRKPPVAILITAYPAWKVYAEAISAGAAIVLSKPLNLQTLARVIRSAALGAPPADAGTSDGPGSSGFPPGTSDGAPPGFEERGKPF